MKPVFLKKYLKKLYQLIELFKVWATVYTQVQINSPRIGGWGAFFARF
jgi:hypothetical protein